jgi:hypothetical protein
VDPYLSRDLIWCELCKRPMVPIVLIGSRYYTCETDECQQMVPAEGIELLIWQQYALLYEGTENVVATAMRRNALRQHIARIRVGEDMFEFRCDWKDEKHEQAARYDRCRCRCRCRCDAAGTPSNASETRKRRSRPALRARAIHPADSQGHGARLRHDSQPTAGSRGYHAEPRRPE